MEALLKIRNLSKSFGKKKVIDNISFDAFSGEVLGFLGPNGAGKTTTIKMVMGFLSVDEGSVEVCGLDLDKNYEKAMANLGGIVENPELYTGLSGRKNLEMYARLHDGVTRERIDEVIKIVGMENRIDDKVKHYSLGMKQRVGLAQAMIHKPRILILDEPTNGLDPAGIKDLRDVLKYLAHKENTAVIVSSHQLAEMELMCDRVCIISKGTIVGEKPVSDFLSGSGNSAYRLEISPETDSDILRSTFEERFISFSEGVFRVTGDKDSITGVIKNLIEKDIDIYSVTKDEMSLEEAFIGITEGVSENE